MNSIVYLHNGNTALRLWMENNHLDHIVMPNMCDNWEWEGSVIVDWQQKLQLIKSQPIVTQITSADAVSVPALVALAHCAEMVKVITSHEHDCANLDPCWDASTYNHQQWITATVQRFWISDRVMQFYTQPIVKQTTGGSVIFTPGRCGSNVLSSITGIDSIVHHQLYDLDTKVGTILVQDPELLDTLVLNKSNVLSVLRRRFFDQVTSDAVYAHIDPHLAKTRRDTLEQNKKLLSTTEHFKITAEDINSSLEKIITFVNNLFTIHYVYGKNPQLYFFEDLSDYFDNIKSVKNPYNKAKLIDNYDTIQVLCDSMFQPVYDIMLARCQQVFGHHIL